MFLVAGCLFLSLLAKEAGILFIIMTLLYFYLFDKKRFKIFIGIIALPVILYIILKIHAVGLASNPADSPIDSLSLSGRLLTIPSILLFYISKFIFPWKLASGYYWVHSTFSIRYVLLPLVLDLTVIGLFVYLGTQIKRRLSKEQLYAYLFFAVWAAIGLLICSQVIPLDMTVCETWFYFSMAGLLGMIGVVLIAFQKHIRPQWFFFIVIILIALLGLRTAVRGTNWKSSDVLDGYDIAGSPGNFIAYNDYGEYLLRQQDYTDAVAYEQKSTNIYPTYDNEYNLGQALTYLGDYADALKAYNHTLMYVNPYDQLVYEKISLLTYVYGTPALDKQMLLSSLSKYPKDSTIWTALAILDERYFSNADAKAAITNAATYGQIPQALYDDIINKKPFSFNTLNLQNSIDVP